MPRPIAPARRSPRPSRRAPPNRPSWSRRLAGAFALGIMLFLVVVMGWKLVNLGLQSLAESKFQRTDIATLIPPEPVQPYAPRVDTELEAALRQAAVAPGTVSVAVRNVTTGARAEVNADEVYPSASLFKLPVLVEILKQTRLRRISMDEQVLLRQDQWADGSGVLQARIGERVSVRELLRLMIAESDNVAALALMDLAGTDNINATMQGMGLEWTKVQDRRISQSLHVTTARDMAVLMEIIASGHLVDRETSEEAVRLLELKQAQNWLGNGLPWWAKMAHKWGELPSVRHDAAIIFTPKSTWSVVVLTRGADVNSSAEVITRVARTTFDYFTR